MSTRLRFSFLLLLSLVSAVGLVSFSPDLKGDSFSSVQEAMTTCVAEGYITGEYWDEIQGQWISNLLSNTRYPDSPSVANILYSLETSPNLGINYGQRISGYVCPPETGNYVFYLSGYRQAQLFLSNDETRANRIKIAGLQQSSAFRDFYASSSQQSMPVYLEAGKNYYIEVLHKNDNGRPNHVSVGWQLPSGTTEAPIPGNRLAPYNPRPTDSRAIILNAAEGDQVRITNNSAFDFGTSDFTIEATILPVNGNGRNGYHMIASKRGYIRFAIPKADGFLMMLHNNKLLVQLNGYNYFVNSDWSYDGLFHHVAASRTNGTLKLYIDGQLEATFLNADSRDVNSIANLVLGFDPLDEKTNNLNGQFKEFRIWNTGKTEAEIAASAFSSLTGNEPNLVLLYEFKEGKGQIVNDKSQNGIDGVFGYNSSVETNDPKWLLNPVQSFASATTSFQSFTLMATEPTTSFTEASNIRLHPVADTAMVKQSFSVQSYPNPFVEEISVVVPGYKDEKVLVKIYDSYGYEVFSSSEFQANIDFKLGKQLQKGTYSVRIKTLEKETNFRIIKE